MKRTRKSAGFTLIELMVVILIIVILGTIGLVSYSQATKSARDGKRKADIESVRQAMILWRQENTGSYPSTIAALVTAGYLSAPAPADPDSSQSYTITSTTSTTFCACARVSNPAKNGNNTTKDNCTSITSTPSISTLYYCARQP